jgi:hypothetical protein
MVPIDRSHLAGRGKGSLMRRRLARGLTAALLAVAVVLPGSARPAQAYTVDELKKIIDLANGAVTLVKSVLGGLLAGDQLHSAVQQIVAAVEAAKTEIISHIDAIATAEVQACARHHVIEFADIDRFTPDVLQGWAQDATGCATLADSTLRVVVDKAAADNLGFALNVIGPIALAARAEAGFRTFGLMTTLRGGNETIVVKLAPACRLTITPTPVIGLTVHNYTCQEYNGDTAAASALYHGATPVNKPINESQVQAEAAQHTTRAVATAVLPALSSP